ncbi:formylglycine-generating enzyme family protein [Micromonospora wenchangensis]|uniref:formylglycine-generating enzyme family protein n=1 Tax=Micromonospora wenchangensis TaxID=1185415 RepID=UPI00381B099F
MTDRSGPRAGSHRADNRAEQAHHAEWAALGGPLDSGPTLTTRLATAGPTGLVALVEDPAATLADRLAAGAVLALLGDPRTGERPAVRPVPGGPVEIGLPADRVAAVTAAWAHVGVEEPWIAKENPAHRVVLADYWIGTYPVTNAEYRRYLADTPDAPRPRTWYLGAYPWDRGNHPVAGVRPADADGYAGWLTRRTGHPWRLPTEAEWEHAAKGPAGTDFPWGDRFDPAAANTRETGVHTTTPVGAFPAGRSWCGAYDLAGNVEEYVADDYRPYPGGHPVHDDLVATIGRYRVARGGSFARHGDLARTRRRHGGHPGPLYPIGFRLASSEPPR